MSPDLKDGRAGAQVRLEAGFITAEAHGGETFRIPQPACRLDQGGASGKMIFCRDEARDLIIFSEARGFLEALASASPDLEPEVNRLREAGLRAARTRRRWTLGLTAAAVGLVVGGYYGVRFAAARAMQGLPIEVDSQIGSMARDSLVDSATRVEDPVVLAAVEQIVERLEPHAEAQAGLDFQFETLVLEGPDINAFALPGGTVVVYTGLLEHAQDVDQVAGVLAHELAHVTRRHGIRRIGQSLGVIAAVQLLLGDVGGLAGTAVEVLQVAAVSSYGRDQESESDADAVRTLHAAGLDPTRLADFFRTLAQAQGDVPEILAWQSTHPQHVERVEAIETLAEALGPTQAQPLDIDWPEVQAHLGDGPKPSR